MPLSRVLVKNNNQTAGNVADTAPRTIGIDPMPTMEQPGFAPFVLGQQEGITCPENAHNRLSISINTAGINFVARWYLTVSVCSRLFLFFQMCYL